MRYFIQLLVLVLLFTGIVIAQDDTAPIEGCEADDFTTFLAEQSEVLAESEDLDLALRDLINTLSTQRADCAGLLFNDERNGKNKVLGPITLEEGLWKVTVTTEGYFSAPSLEVLSGECEPTSYILLNLGRDDAIDGAEALIRSSGCEVLIPTSNVSDAWEMRIEKMN